MPFPKFVVGGASIWHMTRYGRVVYRNGIVQVVPGPISSYVTVKPNGFKGGTAVLYSFQNVVAKEAIKTPPETNFLLEMEGLSSLFYEEYKIPFSIFKCAHKAQGGGEQGYVIIPGPSRIHYLHTFKKEWKTWMVEPKAKALLSFLSHNLDEILSVSTILQKKETTNEG